MSSLAFDLSLVPSDAWQVIHEVDSSEYVYSMSVALYTDTTFSTWAETQDANTNSLVSEYSDNTLALHCSVSKAQSIDFALEATKVNMQYCLIGKENLYGGGAYQDQNTGDWSVIIFSVAVGYDVDPPVVGG